MFDRHQHGAAPFAADAKSLRDAQHHERDRCPRSDLLIRRQQPDQKRGDAHHHQRQHEHRLASDPIAVVADDDAADGTRNEADGVGAERGECAGQRVKGRKEQAVEHECGRRPIEKKVVPLDRGADETGEGHRSNRAMR
jgi:hypothetical protein